MGRRRSIAESAGRQPREAGRAGRLHGYVRVGFFPVTADVIRRIKSRPTPTASGVQAGP